MSSLKVVPSLFFKLACDDSQYGTFLNYLHFSLSVVLTLSIQLYWFKWTTFVSRNESNGKLQHFDCLFQSRTI